MDFLRQLRARDELRYKARTTLENVDFLITPTTPFAAPILDEIDRDDVYFSINGLCLRNTIAVNLLGLLRRLPTLRVHARRFAYWLTAHRPPPRRGAAAASRPRL